MKNDRENSRPFQEELLQQQRSYFSPTLLPLKLED
jgi:hypothetical protein